MWVMGELFLPYGFTSFFCAVLLCIISFYIFKRLSGDGPIIVSRTLQGHSWSSVKITAKTWYCSICEALLLNGTGVYCDCCGVCADPDCVKKANFGLKCKVISSNDQNQLHHWIKGNLPFPAICSYCDEECSRDPGLIDFRCCWCQMTVHTGCLQHITKECDFGKYRNIIIPPACVQTIQRKGPLNKHLLLGALRDPCWDKWCPLIIVANKKSGNGDGASILSEFRKYLNPIQVIDLNERKPLAALQLCVLLSPKKVNILVAGGDGTISWMLTTSYKLDLDMLYVTFGTQQAVTSECKHLERRLDLYLDGRLVELPELESVVVLNISSWGAGVNLWGMCVDVCSENTLQSYNDGILEVVGIYSSFHMAQLQVGISAPLRLGQAKVVEIHLKQKAPMQVDGEPWEQQPGKLKVSFVNRCPVFVNQI
ncbi:diacylglycerol kinase epsilon isoform X3 [Diorhabda carinulata]|uniref:diacylglycerol kinase epsilon isoform X3 n=1 Tax=Diorhabda carinulata TaxID=1163345 RepID=UPI0025A2FA5D|nr:diacylglycerol kinase epsilon isoform X3 [Diorhabda carinulata]